jgi:hypothetical protein
MIIITIDDRGDVSFPLTFDELYQQDVIERGYLSHVVVVMPDGCRYPLHFIEPIRLQQDLEQDCKFGPCLFVEVGLVIIPDLRLETLTTAVRALIERGYFRFLRTIDEAPNPWEV